MFALVVIGPPGAGKSSVLEALSDLLVVDDVAHAMVETEWLTATHPPLDDAQWFAHVQAACGLHREQGQRLLVAATVDDDADLGALLDATAADEHVVVRLEAERETLRRRIIAREPGGWSGLEQLVDASARLGPAIAGLHGVALALSTEGQQPAAVAARIRDAFPRALRSVQP